MDSSIAPATDIMANQPTPPNEPPPPQEIKPLISGGGIRGPGG